MMYQCLSASTAGSEASGDGGAAASTSGLAAGSSGVASAETGSGSTVSTGCPPSSAIACTSAASSECSCEPSALSSSIGLISSWAIYFSLTRECVGQLGYRAIADVIHHHEESGKREDSDDDHHGCGANLFPGRPSHATHLHLQFFEIVLHLYRPT